MGADLTLVTGVTGLVGNNLVRHMLSQGRPVRVLVRDTSDPRPLAGLDVEIVQGDLRDAASIRRACAGVRGVIHAAGLVQLGRSRIDLHWDMNVEGTRRVAQAAREAGARLVHVSSTDALGVRSLEEPADEQTPPVHPTSCCYVLSKREAERVVLEEVGRGLDAVLVNPGFMLGPWDWKPSSGRMLLEVARGRCWLAPQGCFSVGDVRDVAAGIVAALQRGATGQRYILGGLTMSYLDAWRLFAEISGGRRPLGRAPRWSMRLAGWAGDLATRLTGREPDVNSASVRLAMLPKSYASRRAQEQLGYHLRPVRESVQDAWDWFCQHGYAKSKART